jgi:hypothetical protein
MQKTTSNHCPNCSAQATVLGTYPQRTIDSKLLAGFNVLKCPRGHLFTVKDSSRHHRSGPKPEKCAIAKAAN